MRYEFEFPNRKIGLCCELVNNDKDVLDDELISFEGCSNAENGQLFDFSYFI